jgi:hypothetical protein
MFALTIAETYARSICDGLKTIEWRSRQTSHRGLVAIHAAKPVGAIIGLAEIIGCEDLGAPTFWPDLAGLAIPGNQNPHIDRWPIAWLLQNARYLPTPIPCRGNLGLWEVPADVLRQITDSPGLPR